MTSRQVGVLHPPCSLSVWGRSIGAAEWTVVSAMEARPGAWGAVWSGGGLMG